LRFPSRCRRGSFPPPFGLRPKECVHEVPNNALLRTVEKGVEVVSPDGHVEFLPELESCMAFQEKYSREHPRKSHIRVDGAMDVPSGWLDNAFVYTPTGRSAVAFSGNYLVPPTPKTTGGLIYYFIGLVNWNNPETILQPVLTYYSSWYMNSWNCCPSGQVHTSPTLAGFAPGDLLNGNIYYEQNNDTWTTVSTFRDNSVVLNVDSKVGGTQRLFNWADATLETYDVASCDMLPTGWMNYTNMVITLDDGTTYTPQWTNQYGATDCNGVLQIVNPTAVSISHN